MWLMVETAQERILPLQLETKALISADIICKRLVSLLIYPMYLR